MASPPFIISQLFLMVFSNLKLGTAKFHKNLFGLPFLKIGIYNKTIHLHLEIICPVCEKPSVRTAVRSMEPISFSAQKEQEFTEEFQGLNSDNGSIEQFFLNDNSEVESTESVKLEKYFYKKFVFEPAASCETNQYATIAPARNM